MTPKQDQIWRSLRSDTRAVSTQVGYVLTIGIIAILMAGLISSTGGLVSQTINQGTQAELQIIGDRIAAQVMVADRILETDAGSSTLILNADVPAQAGGKPYTISYDDSELILESTGHEVIVSVPLQTNHTVHVESSQTSELRIYNDGTDIKIGSKEDASQ